MNFAFSEEQEQLRQIVNEFMTAKSPEAGFAVGRVLQVDETHVAALGNGFNVGGGVGVQGPDVVIPDEDGGIVNRPSGRHG